MKVRPSLPALALALAIGSLATGCLAGTGDFDWYASTSTTHAALPPAPPPPSRPTQLVRRHADGARYHRVATAWIGVAGVGHGMRVSLGGEVTVRPQEGGYREDAEVTHAEADGAAVYMDPREGTPPMIGTRMRMSFDRANRPTEEPAVLQVDPAADTLVTEIARVVFGTLRVPFPHHAVRPGDSWSGEPMQMDTRGSGGWVAVTMRPRFRLERIEDGEAFVRWTGTVSTQPFCQLGPCLIGQGTLRGTSRIALADGFSGRTDLSYEVSVRGQDADPETPPILDVEMRFSDSRRRM